MSDHDQETPFPPERGQGFPPPQGGPGYPPPERGQGFPPYPPAATGAGEPADLMPRFVARLVDYVILFVVNTLIVSAIVVGYFMKGSAGPYPSIGTAGTYAGVVVSSLLTTAVYLGYFTVMEATTGSTVGKRLMKLETRGPGGGKPTWGEALRRNAWTAVGVLGLLPVVGSRVGPLATLAAVIGIAVTINNDRTTRHGWHDRFAGGTTVVKVG